MRDIIRIHAGEYAGMPEALHAHFNLAPAQHVVGRRYALPRIVVPGQDGANGFPPVLDFQRAWLCECVHYVERIAISDLDDAVLALAMRHLRSKAEVERVILERYGRSRPDWSEERMLSNGISITFLRKVGELPADGIMPLRTGSGADLPSIHDGAVLSA